MKSVIHYGSSRSVSLGVILSASLLASLACDDETTPSGEVELSAGPVVYMELSEARRSVLGELGELALPLPNDALFQGASAARISSRSDVVSGRGAFTLRDSLSSSPDLVGWGASLAPLGGYPLNPIISIPLSEAIDLDDLLARHTTETSLDDAVYLVCLSSHCAGEVTPLELGRRPLNLGVFAELNALAEAQGDPTPELLTQLSAPLPLAARDAAMQLDTRGDVTSLVWGQAEQRSGVISLSRAPTLGERAVVLNLTPSEGLAPHTSYAVIVTRALRSTAGAVQTTLPTPHLPEHEGDWRTAREHLTRLGLSEDDVVVMWRFSTGDPLAVYQTLRAGLTARDPLTPLERRVASLQPRLTATHEWVSEQSVAGCERRGGSQCEALVGQTSLSRDGVRGLALAWAAARADEGELSEDTRLTLVESYKAVKGLVSGELSGWSVDALSGDVSGDDWSVKDRTWPFWCVIPRAGRWVDRALDNQERSAPFPVIFWSGDQPQERLDLLLWAGHFSRFGFASCAIDTLSTQSDYGLISGGLSPEVERKLSLELSLEWGETSWDVASALQVIRRGETLAPRGDHAVSWQRRRPLNRALATQQLALWLSDLSPSADPSALQGLKASLHVTPRSNEDTTGEASSAASLSQLQEWPTSGSVYAGQGSGGAAATMSATLDPLALGLITVDLEAYALHSAAVGEGDRGGAHLLHQSFGPWLTWGRAALDIESGEVESGERGWRWRATTGLAHVNLSASEPNAQDVERSPLWAPEGMSEGELAGAWVALYNERSDQLGVKRAFMGEGTAPLTVAAERGDPLKLYVFNGIGDESPRATSSSYLFAPDHGSGVTPASGGARLAWRASHWALALDDPLELTRALTGVDDREESPREVRTLVIAHPQTRAQPLSASLMFAKRLGIGRDDEPRAELYGLTPHQFLMLSQAYEPQRAWSGSWFDWDDLDLLTESAPPFTRNTQLLLHRVTLKRGYHALRIPWRAEERSGLLPPHQSFTYGDANPPSLRGLTLNLIGGFIGGLRRAASAAELEGSCLYWLAPDVRACSFVSVTDDDEL